VAVDETTRLGRLRGYNAFMGFLHLGQAVAIFALSNTFTLPITASFLTFDAATRTLSGVPETLVNLRLGPFVALFLLISAIAHFSISTFGYRWYAENLKKRINYARWYEYALSSSVMIVIIGMLSGVYDIAAIIAIFALNACMNLFGLMMELHNQTTQKTNWTAYIYGCFAGIVPWIAIAYYFFGSLSRAAGVPTFVYTILPTLFVFFFSFALNMFLQYKGVGRWKDYLFGEQVYVFLSLTAKTALAWQVFAGTLVR
jgi:hypothetical protein